ncbi:MAG TPA: hypothetical protein VG410_13115 [Solirubrobacteraceae bacterium]|jgi:preprotein translocase subunit SecG|nr:hypothetical protein [Solirubrobacteraceae bacterium]
MGPLGFVNWRSVNRIFCCLMWMIALVLVVVVLAHTGGGAGAPHATIAGR